MLGFWEAMGVVGMCVGWKVLAGERPTAVFEQALVKLTEDALLHSAKVLTDAVACRRGRDHALMRRYFLIPVLPRRHVGIR